MPNALAQETSPYLRQHQDNPVNWLAWGEQALKSAREQDKPILLSIGYSACHWCHVMEHESFEDPQVAELMNEHFVCVKVDREERPDLDAIYMEAVQSMTGHGGWPLNVFLTPEQLPFYGGTYFPPKSRQQMPSWTQVLSAVAQAWRDQPQEIRTTGEQILKRLSSAAQLSGSSQPIDSSTLDTALSECEKSYDAPYGGFGSAPKFPSSSLLQFLTGRAAAQPEGSDTPEAQMAIHTLRAMAAGGIHDQIGGGFHRYSVDKTWTVPHFEKMLYDNALLARAYLHGFKLSKEKPLLDVCLGILNWTLREMCGPEGGFYSSLDADSEDMEGKFYLWSIGELNDVLGEDAPAAISWWKVTEQGNFSDPHHPQPGLNILRQSGRSPDEATRQRIARKLLAVRDRRVRPGLDYKRLTAWNALMIAVLAETGAYLKIVPVEGVDSKTGEVFLQAAIRCAEFVLAEMRDDSGRLLRTYSDGQAKLDAYLEDHAFLLEALLGLYEASFQERWFVQARSLADGIIERFLDQNRGGFFSTAADHEELITRRKDLEDTPIPSGASSAALGLLRLARLTGQYDYEDHALGVLALLHEIAAKHPTSFGHLLQAIDFYLSPVREVALVGVDRVELERVVRERLRPHLVLAAGPGDGTPSAVELLAGRTPLAGASAAYVCESFACLRPVTEPEQLVAALLA
jgi:uncharacterized protein